MKLLTRACMMQAVTAKALREPKRKTRRQQLLRPIAELARMGLLCSTQRHAYGTSRRVGDRQQSIALSVQPT
eukprot:1289266-Pleurochrysis_carterae.AAC.1